MRINTNIAALNSHRMLERSSMASARNLEKLSSGTKINRASDDAAGLAISEKMNAQIRGLKMASRNSLDGISLIQTAEGALNEVHAMLQRMRELAVQAANDTNTTEDREKLQLEISQLVSELNRIASTTEFNTKPLLDGEFDGDGLKFHVGANKDQNVSLTFKDMKANALGVDGINLSTQESANEAIETINKALEGVSEERAKYGAMQNRLEHTINNLRVAGENLQAAESRIRDTDMASEIVKFNKSKIIAEAGTAMLAQANTAPQAILQLLQ